MVPGGVVGQTDSTPLAAVNNDTPVARNDRLLRRQVDGWFGTDQQLRA